MNVSKTEDKDFEETIQSIRKFRQTLKEIEKDSELDKTRDQGNTKVVKRSKRVPNGRQSSRQRIEFNSRPRKTTSQRGRNNPGPRNYQSHINNNVSNRVIKQFRNKLTGHVKETVGVTRRGGYSESLPLQNPVVTQGHGDSVEVIGSEFLTFVVGQTTALPSPSVTQPGDCLAIIPLNPMLLPGTRIAQMASLYQKYVFEEILFEFEPSVPSTQDGSLIMLLAYDPNENLWVTTTDPTERMRLILAHEGANIFNVYDYGRTSLVKQPDSLKSYFVREGEDTRQEMQAYFAIAAGSQFSNEEESLTLGSVIIHYKIKFETRAIVAPIDNSFRFTTSVASLTLTATFSSTTANFGVAFTSTSMPGYVANRSLIWIIRYLQPVTVTGTSSMVVYDAYGEYTLGARGSVWYGRSTTDSSSSPMTIYSNFEQAVDAVSTDAVLWKNTLVGTDTIVCTMIINGLSLEDS